MGHFSDGAIGLQVRVVCGTRESARSESRETAVERCALDRLKPERRGRGQCAELKARTKVLVAMRSATWSQSTPSPARLIESQLGSPLTLQLRLPKPVFWMLKVWSGG